MLAVEADRVRGEGHPPGSCPAVPAGAPDRRTRHSSQRRRLAVHLGPVRRHPDARRARRVGRAGRDAYDNALAETTIGLYKTECTRDGSPFRTGPIATLASLEEVTSAWVHWNNTHRLMHRLGRRPPAEAEAGYYQQAAARPGRAA